MFGCAKTEMVSEDNTVTNENIASTTGTIAIETEEIETETQDAIQPSSDQLSEAMPEYKIIMVGDILLHTPVEESCLQPDGSYDYDSLFSHTKEEIAAADLALVNQEVIIGVRILESPGIPVSMRITVSAIHWWEQDSMSSVMPQTMPWTRGVRAW